MSLNLRCLTKLPGENETFFSTDYFELAKSGCATLCEEEVFCVVFNALRQIAIHYCYFELVFPKHVWKKLLEGTLLN